MGSPTLFQSIDWPSESDSTGRSISTVFYQLGLRAYYYQQPLPALSKCLLSRKPIKKSIRVSNFCL